MWKSSLCDYIDAYRLVKERITITEAGAHTVARQADERNKEVTFNNCAPFINCKSGINNTEIYNAKGVDRAMSVYNLIEHSDNYSKKYASLW